MRTRVNWFVVLVSVLVLTHCISSADADDISAIARKQIERLHGLRNIEANFKLTFSSIPPVDIRGRHIVLGRVVDTEASVQNFDCRYAFLNGSAFIRKAPTQETAAAATAAGQDIPDETRIVTDSRSETLIKHTSVKQPLGRIDDSGAMDESVFIDIALGQRLFGAQAWLTDDDLSHAVVGRSEDGLDTLTLTSRSNRHVWYFENGKTQPKRYEVFGSPSVPFLIVEYGDIQEVNGIALPSKIIVSRRSISLDRNGNVTKVVTVEMYELRIAEYKLNTDSNNEKQYHMVWPKNSRFSMFEPGALIAS